MEFTRPDFSLCRAFGFNGFECRGLWFRKWRFGLRVLPEVENDSSLKVQG